jgi:uncharacterized protein (DUF305 family)
MRRCITVLAGVLAGALLLTACGDDDPDTTGAEGGDSSPGAVQVDYNDQDTEFALSMRAHHAQAIEMSDMVLSADPTPEVADLAERIKAAQGPEIEQLDEMLDHMGVEADSSGGHGTGHDTGGMPMHEGMMTDDQMGMLAEAHGVEACRQFLSLMQEHHRGAIASADKQLQNGRYEPALDMARNIRNSQSDEITVMERLLSRL